MSNATACRVCGQPTVQLFVAKVLHRYDVQYFECHSCRFVQTETPHWLEEAYARSINAEDTGMMVRNAAFADRLAVVLFSLFGPRGKFLDYAGGYGVFTRMMRDRGFDFRWTDKYTQNLFALGFEYDPSDTMAALTVFEAFEHFVNPREELQRLLAIADTVIFSTELIAETTPAAGTWWYYGHQHGQHIAFYRPQTLQVLAGQCGASFFSNGHNLHLITKARRVPYCMPTRNFNALNREVEGGLARCYAHASGRSRPKFARDLVDRLRGRSYRVLQLDAGIAPTSIVDDVLKSGSYEDYIRYLLRDDLRSWSRLVGLQLESKTFADMERVIAMQTPPG